MYMYVYMHYVYTLYLASGLMYSTDQMQGIYKARVIYTRLHEEANTLVH